MNIYIILANITAFVHGVVVVYCLSFTLFFFNKKTLPKYYSLPMLPIVLIQQYYLWTANNCPITIFENYLRKLGGQEMFSGGFIEKYTKDIFGFGFPDSVTSLLIGIISSLIILQLITKRLPKVKTVSTRS